MQNYVMVTSYHIRRTGFRRLANSESSFQWITGSGKKQPISTDDISTPVFRGRVD
jgi:hypothetical protein